MGEQNRDRKDEKKKQRRVDSWGRPTKTLTVTIRGNGQEKIVGKGKALW